MYSLRQCFAIFLSFCLIYSQVFYNLAYADDIVIDGSTQTALDKARNGVTVVNIAKPSSRGLSHNKFKRYNVNKQGVILNNASQSSVKTQLGGYIYGNKHLGAGSAKVILNEVTGSSRSHLRGYTEVAGQKADLVLVNPNGISMNGAGFINVPQVTFSTGQANISGGQIDSFSVNQGDVLIEGSGLDTQTQKSTYIYTKSLQLNAKIHAQDLNVALGSNQIDYQTKQVTGQTTPQAKPDAVMLDSSALGGMYANRITLVGTDKGVGVNLPPEVLASSGDITITNDGKIRLNDLTASDNINITSQSNKIDVAGKIHSQNTTLASRENITVNSSAILSAKDQLNLTTQATVDNKGNIVAGTNRDGSNATTGTLAVDAANVTNTQGTIASNVAADIKSTAFDNRDGVVKGNGNTTITTTSFDNRNGMVSGTGNNTIHTTHLDNRDGEIKSDQTLEVNTQTIDLQNSSLYAGQNLNLKLKGLHNIASSKIQSDGNLNIEATDYITNDSELLANGDLTLKTGGNLTNRRTISSQQALHLESANLTNTGGNARISGGAGNSVVNVSGQLDNRSRISSSDQLTFNTWYLTNHASISAGSNLTTNATHIRNYQTLFSGGVMNLFGSSQIVNHPNATLFSIGNMTLGGNSSGGKSNQIVNHKGNIETYHGNLTIRTHNLQNVTDDPSRRTTVGPTTHHKVSGGHKNTYKDYFTTVTTESFTSVPRAAKILSGRDLYVNADTIHNNYSLIAGNRNVHLHTKALHNKSMTTKTVTRVRIESYKNKQKKKKFGPPKDKKRHIGTSHEEHTSVNNSVTATIQAGGSIRVTGGGSLSNGRGGKNTVQARTADLSGVAVQKANLASDQLIQLPAGDYGLFVKSKNPNSHYLIETNPEFTIYENFISSDYLMKNIGIDPAAITKRVGDAFYENKLVRDAIFKQTGRRFLNKNLKNDYDQFKYLMDNALQTARDLELTSGVALTSNQINALTSDIVWMEERIVQGYKVLVPVVYIADPGNYKVQNGGRIIAGENVSLQVASLVNSGSIEAGDSLSITATDSITNVEGQLLAERNMNLHAKNDIRNTGGSMAAENIAIKSDEGSFIHETYAKDVSYGSGRVTDDKTMIGDTATLDAKGNLSIDVAKSAIFKGANVTASDMDVNAEDVMIGAIKNERNFHADLGGGEFVKEASTTYTGSQLNVDNLNITSKEKTTIQGSTINANENISIAAKQIDILSVNNTTHEASNIKSDGDWSSKEESETDFESTNIASVLNAANMELTSTGGDINITGSELNASETIALDSAQDINIRAGYDGTFKEKRTKESGVFKGGKLYSEKENLDGKMTKTSTASLINAGNLSLKSKRDILVEGSDLTAGTITGEGRNITVKTAENIEHTWSKNSEKSVTAGDVKDTLSQPDKLFKTEDKKVSLKVADASIEEADESTKKTTVTSSNLNAGNISLTATSDEEDQGNILVEGSNLNASDTIALTASNDVTIKEAKETTETQSSSTKGKGELTVGAKHQAVEVVKAAEALEQARVAAQQAKSAYDDYKSQKKEAERKYKAGLIDKEDLDDIRDDERYYVANVTLTAASLVAATKNLTQQAIAATQSSGTYGFNADVQLDIDAVVAKAKDISIRSVGSNLAAANITINAGNKALIQGSNLDAKEQIAIAANEVEISASRDTTESSSSREHAHYTQTYSVYGGPNATASVDMNENRSKSASYNNARLNGKHISITSKQDTTITGAVVKAKENLELDVGGDLTVASLQDTSRSKSASMGVSVGSSGSGSANGSLSKSKKKWVTEQTGLLGGNVTIKVKDHTDLKGVKIAAIDENGKDNGNLSLTTNTISVEDIRDRDTNTNTSASVGTDGFESAGQGFSEKTQIAKTTIGQGTIKVGNRYGSDLEDLNRDLENATVSVKDTDVQLDLDADTLDVVLNPIQTADDIVDDTKQIGLLSKVAYNMAEAAAEQDGSFVEGVDAVAMGFNAVNNPAKHARGETELGQLLANTENMNAEQLQEVVSDFFQDMQSQGKILDPSTMKLVSTDGLTDAEIREYQAATDEKTLQSYLNIQTTDVTDGASIVESLSAETIRQQYARGNQTEMEDGSRNEALEEAVEHVAAGASKESWTTFSDEERSTSSTHQNWLEQHKNAEVVKEGNKELNSTDHQYVLPYCTIRGKCDTREEEERYDQERERIEKSLNSQEIEKRVDSAVGMLDGVKEAYEENRMISTASDKVLKYGSDTFDGIVATIDLLKSGKWLSIYEEWTEEGWQEMKEREYEMQNKVLEPEEAAKKLAESVHGIKIDVLSLAAETLTTKGLSKVSMLRKGDKILPDGSQISNVSKTSKVSEISETMDKTALISADNLTKKTNQVRKKRLEVGKVEIYGESKKVTGDGTVHRDHIPSKGALLRRAEELKGSMLSPAEIKKIENNSLTISVPAEVHKAGPTYAGKNKLALQKSDAKDLQSAAHRDTSAMIENAKVIEPEHVSILKEKCKGITCMTNQQYDDFLYQQLDE